MTDPQPYDHVRPTAADVPEGVYRVVGTGDPVALLRVTDGDGRRANTGEVETVPRETLADGFVSAENPDAGFSPGSFLAPFRAYADALRYWLGL